MHGNIREMAVTECSKRTFNTISINCKRQQLVGLMTIYHHMGLLKRGFFRPKEQPSLNISGTLSINDLLQVIIRMVGLLQMRIQIKTRQKSLQNNRLPGLTQKANVLKVIHRQCRNFQQKSLTLLVRPSKKILSPKLNLT